MTRIVVGRLDNNKPVEVDEGTSIREAINAGGYHKAETEVIQDIEGNEYEGSEDITSGSGYYLVQRVKSGNY